MNPELDLEIQRIIRATPDAIWEAWTNPEQLAQWWLPAPMQCRVEQLDAVPGGALVTTMSTDGAEFVPHVNACFLVVAPRERLVFSNAIDSEWRPANPAPVRMTAEVVLRAHPEGTDYRVLVRHGSADDRATHEEVGFREGWGAVTEQLATLVEGRN
ncbi:MAG: SRPBCC domain-containing protein [Dehalococcoidia bacterium]